MYTDFFMKYFFTIIFFLFLTGQLSAQTYLPANSARLLIRNAKTPADKFKGYRGLDRYYYTTGLYDSSEMVQKKMYAIAESLKSDSMMVMVYRAIGNRFTTKSDYNFAISNYFKGLQYAKTDVSKAIFYGNLAYVYAITGNDRVALNYLNKSGTVRKAPLGRFNTNIFYGLVYNNLNKPDSALTYLQEASNLTNKDPDPTMTSILLAQNGKAYELRREPDLAEVYYKRVVAYCKAHNLASGQIRHGNLYCDFLIKSRQLSPG